jgi:hypothetical protein
MNDNKKHEPRLIGDIMQDMAKDPNSILYGLVKKG